MIFTEDKEDSRIKEKNIYIGGKIKKFDRAFFGKNTSYAYLPDCTFISYYYIFGINQTNTII